MNKLENTFSVVMCIKVIKGIQCKKGMWYNILPVFFFFNKLQKWIKGLLDEN